MVFSLTNVVMVALIINQDLFQFGYTFDFKALTNVHRVSLFFIPFCLMFFYLV